MRYFYREPIQPPGYSQEHWTWIMLGRFAHLYNESFGIWFVIAPAPDDPMSLERANTVLVETTKDRFFMHAGPRARREMWEDRIGIRLCWIAAWLRKFPFLRRSTWLKRIAEEDARQDFQKYDETAEPPRIGMGMGQP